MASLENGVEYTEAKAKATKTYGRYADAVKYINPRKE